MSENLCITAIAKLKELTENLPPFPRSVDVGSPGTGLKINTSEDSFYTGTSDGYKEYKMDSGECFAWFIHRSGNAVAVHRWFAIKGTKFPVHSHPVKELAILYEGRVEHTQDGITKLLVAGDFNYAPANAPHSAVFLEDSKFITVTIPPEKEFPNVIG
jgi:quercetin dioxygenase-like cupin family protein